MSSAMSPGGDPLTRQNVEPNRDVRIGRLVAFVGVMMVILGTFHVIDGLVAIFKDEFFLVGKSVRWSMSTSRSGDGYTWSQAS